MTVLAWELILFCQCNQYLIIDISCTKPTQKTYKRAASDECILRIRKEARARTLSLLIISKSREPVGRKCQAGLINIGREEQY